MRSRAERVGLSPSAGAPDRPGGTSAHDTCERMGAKVLSVPGSVEKSTSRGTRGRTVRRRVPLDVPFLLP